MTIEPQPAGPTFVRCALRGAHAGPNTSYGDIHIYKYIYQESQICTISYCARFAREIHLIYSNAIYLIINNTYNNYFKLLRPQRGEEWGGDAAIGMHCPSTGQSLLVKKVFSAGGGVLGGHSLCHGLPDASSGGDCVLGQSSQSLQHDRNEFHPCGAAG